MTKNDTSPSDISPTTLFEGLGLDDAVSSGESPHVTFDTSVGGATLLSGGFDDAAASRVMLDEDPVDIGVNIAHVVDPSRLCMGFIGRTKTKFCILAKGKCTVQSHKGRRFDEASPGLYCLDACSGGSNSGVCLTAPFVERNLLHDTEFHALMIESKDLEELQKQFALTAMREEEPVDEDSADAVTDLIAQIDDYKTPKKEKLTMIHQGDGASSATLDGGRTFSGAFNGFRDKLKDFDNVICEKLDVDTLQEKGLQWSYELGQMKSYLTEQSYILDTFAHAVSDKLALVDGMVHKLKTIEGRIGTQSELLKLHGTEPVVWNAIAGLVDSGTSSMLEYEKLKEVVTSGDIKVTKLQAELQVILKSFKNKMELNTSGLVNLRREMQDLKVTAVNHAAGGKKVEGDGSRGTGQSRSNLLGLSFLDNGQSSKSVPSNTTPTQSADSQPSSSASAKLNNADLWSTMKLVDTLEDRVEALESFKQGQDEKMLEEAVKLMGVVFTGRDDVERWYCSCVEDSDGLPPCGLFVDPLIAFYWIGTRIHGGGASKTKLDNLLKGKKLEMSELEMGAYESFDNDIPTVFLGESKEMTVITDEDKSKLANLPSFKAWHHPGREKGLSQQIRSSAQLVKGALHNAITDALSKHDKLYSMALEMLETSFEFVSQLSNYITNTFIDFRELEVGSEKDIWNLIVFVVEHLFKNDFARARQLSITRLNAGDRDSAFVVMWCSLRSVGVAKALANVGISDSPAVSASYTRFVLTQSNRGKISAVEEENERLRKEMDALKADLASIKSQAKEAKRTADSAMSKVNKKQRVGDDKKN